MAWQRPVYRAWSKGWNRVVRLNNRHVSTSLIYTGSSPVSVNIWFDVDNNGEFFVWNGNALTSLGNDKYILGPSTNQNVLSVDGNSIFNSLIPGGGNYTLAQLKSGAAPGITSATKIAIWVGIATGGGSLTATITSLQKPGITQPYTYTGREYDPESGLYYYRARYYDASTGRFISKDPIGFNGGDINLYRYVGNNPVNWNDPNGQWLIGAVIGGIAGGIGGFNSALINGEPLGTAIVGGLVGGVTGAVVGGILPDLLGLPASSAAGAVAGSVVGGIIGGAVGGAVSGNPLSGALTGGISGLVAAPGVGVTAVATEGSELAMGLMGAVGSIMGDTVQATGTAIINNQHKPCQ